MTRSSARHLLPLFIACVSLSGCAENIGEVTLDAENETNDEDGDDDDKKEGKVRHSSSDGVTMTLVDSTDEEAWVYLDLDAADEGEASGELDEDESGWDLGLRRFEIKLNGGISGDEEVELGYSENADFDALSEPPQDLVWITDGDTVDEDGQAVLAFDDWYDYNVMTHTLAPKARVYFVRTSNAQLFKLAIVDYYSTAGSPGHLAFKWAPI